VKLADDCPEDVRDYMQQNKFVQDPPEADSSAEESYQEDEKERLEGALEKLRGISLHFRVTKRMLVTTVNSRATKLKTNSIQPKSSLIYLT
jgi:hypothetical protein